MRQDLELWFARIACFTACLLLYHTVLHSPFSFPTFGRLWIATLQTLLFPLLFEQRTITAGRSFTPNRDSLPRAAGA